MSAAPSHTAESHPLLQGASPRTIGEWLSPELRRRFVRDYEAALDRARVDLDLEGLHEEVERWRQIAVLQTDPVGFRRTMRRAAEIATGEPSPEDEAWETTLAKAGM
ncbi:DUF6247 family protein [Actinomycetospora sp. OC33-EN08]|uniref:DUF6247 family protein n=1 Tax=Actinomycetospora aurantiaca TaxID=3129233 RepID=A0ABU8MP76_9PSEU